MAVSNNEKFDIRKFASPIKKYHLVWAEQCYAEILSQAEVIERIGNIILPKTNMFLAADGRSQYMLYCVGERFNGMGYHVQGIGDHFTTSMKNSETDVLLGSTGTGTSKTVINAADVAKKLNIPFILLTSYENSSAAQSANEKLIIRGRTKDTVEQDYESRQLKGEQTEVAGALGSQFEIKSLFALECIANHVGHMKGVTEKELKDRHPN